MIIYYLLKSGIKKKLVGKLIACMNNVSWTYRDQWELLINRIIPVESLVFQKDFELRFL